MRVGNVRVLHSGFGWIVSWPGAAPAYLPRAERRRRGAAFAERADSYFFAAGSVEDGAFDDLREGDRVEFLVVEPQPERGPRAYAVRRVA